MILSSPSAFGLDLSDLSIKLALLKKQKKNFTLASWSRLDIPQGIIEEGKIKQEESLINIIREVSENTQGDKLRSKYCVVSLPETESYVRVIQLPHVNQEEIGEAIKWELEANIPVSVNDVYFDWQIIEEASSPQNHTDILIGALPKNLIDPYLEVIKKAGLKPLAFEIESVAIARALIKESEWSEPVLIADLGAKHTVFIIYAGGAIWFTCSAPISNSLLIGDIAKILKISYEDAKSMKLNVGLDLFEEGGKIFRAMEPRLIELASEIKKYLEYYRINLAPNHPQSPQINRILLCGGGANLKGLAGFLSSELKVKVSVGNPWVNILRPETKELPGLSFPESLAFTTALGLALRGFSENQ